MQYTTRTNYAVLLTVLLLGCLSTVTAQANEDEKRVGVEVTVKPERAAPGATVMLTVKLALADGAHANANDITDPNLIPTAFLPKPAAGIAWGQPEYPRPTQVNEWYSADPLSVYQDGAVISVPLTIERTAMTGQLSVEGTLRIQVCDKEKCYPVQRVPARASITIVSSSNPEISSVSARPAANEGSPPVEKTSFTSDTTGRAKGIDFSFVDFTGKERKLSEFRGKFVLLDFWATWCKPCLADIPKLKELYEKYKSGGFEIIGMDTETIGDEAEEPDPEFVKQRFEQAKKIVSTRGVTWTQATNETAVPIAMKVFNVKALPTKILIDREGNVLATIGEKDDLTGIVEKLINPKNQ